MQKRVFLASLGVSLTSFPAQAVTCTQGVDWVLPLCEYTIGDSRCIMHKDNAVAKTACGPEVAGCAEIGGCFGFLPAGHWYPYVENNTNYRCMCGCFAEETVFKIGNQNVTGRDLSANRHKTNQFLDTFDSFESFTQSPREINGIISGPEEDKSYLIKTREGKSVILSSAHPVLIVDQHGALKGMKKASEVKIGEFVLSEANSAEEISAVIQDKYNGKMVNFNVASDDPAHHIVSANGLRLGDNAWQQRLASVEAKILFRADILRDLMRQQKANN